MSVCGNCATLLPDGSHFCSHCGTPVPGRGAPSTPLSPQVQEVFDRLQSATEGRYEILSELGRGGMAIVFLGYQMSLDRQIAIKVLLPFLAFDSELVERFLREARTQGKLDHPSIIKVYEVYNRGDLTFFTMPYVSGPSLRTFLVGQPRPDLATVQRYLRQAADALAYAHRRGVIHRDVKPDNMVIDAERDCAILTDFGIAKALAAETTLTTPGDLLGTPQYMAPEQGEGKVDLDGRADQYSLGLIGWEMLAGRRPFEADSLAELMYKHRFEEPDDLDRLRPDAPPALRHAIMRAIRKERDERFSLMEDFLAAVEADGSLPGVEEDRTEPMPASRGTDTTVRVATPPDRAATSGPARPRAAPAPAARAGRRGPRPALWLGGVFVLATAVAALVVLDPLDLRVGGDGEPGQWPGGAARPASGEADALAAGGGVTGEEAASAGEESAANLPLGQEMPEAAGGGGEVAEVPGERAEPGVPDPSASRARAAAVQARERAGSAQAEVQAAGAAELFAAELDWLSRRFRAAEDEFAAARYDRAAAMYAESVRDYTAVAEEAAAKRRDGALAALSERFYPERLAELDRRRANAEARLRAADLDAARKEFLALAAGYQTLAGQANQAARPEALSAQRRVAEQRQAALRREAPALAAERFQAADSLRAQATQELTRGRNSGALRLFEQAELGFAQLTADLPVQPPEAEGAGEAAGPASEGVAEIEIAKLIERFRELFEREEMARIRAELFRGEIPRQDARILRFIFQSADEIRVTRFATRNMAIRGESASADVKFEMRFLQSRTRERRGQDLDFRMRFTQGPDGWRLESLGARR